MALIRSGTTGVGFPLLYYELYADQVGGSGNDRTIKITIKTKVNGSSGNYYGFPVNWRAYVNGTWAGWTAMKGSETWYGSEGLRTFSQTLTVNVGTTSSKTILVGFGTDSYNGDNDWDSNTYGDFTVGATNRAPEAPSSITVRLGSTSSSPVATGIVPENVNTLFISWNASYDADGDQLTYALNQSVRGGGYTQIYFGTGLEHIQNVSGWSEGDSIQFYVDTRDSKNEWSPKTYSSIITKNTLSAGEFTGRSNDIDFNSTSFELYFEGGKNIDGSLVEYSCYSNTVTIYNQEYTSSVSQRISIIKEGQSEPNAPYIKFGELVEVFKQYNYTGRLHIGLKTRNSYGTEKTKDGSIGVNIQVEPLPPTNLQIIGGTALINVAGENVFLPDGKRTILLSWEESANGLGADFTYDIYQIYNGVEMKLDSVPSATISYSHSPVAQVDEIALLAYKVVAITSYGFQASVTSSQITLNYYSQPGIKIGEIFRTDTAAEVDVDIIENTSIPSVFGLVSWSSSNKQVGSFEDSGKIILSGLLPDSSYSIIVTYSDNSGLSSKKNEIISIGRNLPIVDINQYGLGIGGVFANPSVALNINGSLDALTVLEKGQRLYSPQNKPSAEDIGALPLTGGSLSGSLTVPSLVLSSKDNSYLDFTTLSLGKGYEANSYSQIFFKGETNDDGRIIHYEHDNTAQLWIIPSDDTTVNDEVVFGALRGRAGNIDMIGGQWLRSFTFLMDGTFIMRPRPQDQDANLLEKEGCMFAGGDTPNAPIAWSQIRSFGDNEGHCFQLGSFYGSTSHYFIRSQYDIDKSWKAWAKIVISEDKGISSLKNGSTYLQVNTSSGVKGINWWDCDLKYKRNIVELSRQPMAISPMGRTPGLDVINAIDHFKYDLVLQDGQKHIECGYIAQQLEEVRENLVITIEQPEDSPYWSKNNPTTKNPNETIIIPYITKAMQEMYLENQELKKQIETLSRENYIISREVAKIQKMLGMSYSLKEGEKKE